MKKTLTDDLLKLISYLLELLQYSLLDYAISLIPV